MRRCHVDHRVRGFDMEVQHTAGERTLEVRIAVEVAPQPQLTQEHSAWQAQGRAIDQQLQATEQLGREPVECVAFRGL
jgi:hypothetical protein